MSKCLNPRLFSKNFERMANKIVAYQRYLIFSSKLLKENAYRRIDIYVDMLRSS